MLKSKKNLITGHIRRTTEFREGSSFLFDVSITG
jgi:hypothetical protein